MCSRAHALQAAQQQVQNFKPAASKSGGTLHDMINAASRCSIVADARCAQGEVQQLAQRLQLPVGTRRRYQVPSGFWRLSRWCAMAAGSGTGSSLLLSHWFLVMMTDRCVFAVAIQSAVSCLLSTDLQWLMQCCVACDAEHSAHGHTNERQTVRLCRKPATPSQHPLRGRRR